MHTPLRTLNPVQSIRTLWSSRSLLRELVIRDVALRYKGSVLGYFWAILTPLITLAIFTYVFSVVLRARWPGMPEQDSHLGFALAAFCGMVGFQAFSEPVGRSATLITSNPNFVKKIVFPLEALPLMTACSAAVLAVLNLITLLAVTWLVTGRIPVTVVAWPLVILPALLLGLGVAWFVAALGVYLRDLGQLIGPLLQMLYLLTPVLYPLSAVPEAVRWLVGANPLTVVAEGSRAVLVAGQWPDWSMLATALLVSVCVAQLGYAWFVTTKWGFADVV